MAHCLPLVKLSESYPWNIVRWLNKYGSMADRPIEPIIWGHNRPVDLTVYTLVLDHHLVERKNLPPIITIQNLSQIVCVSWKAAALNWIFEF